MTRTRKTPPESLAPESLVPESPAREGEPGTPSAGQSKAKLQFGPTPSAPGSRLKKPKAR